MRSDRDAFGAAETQSHPTAADDSRPLIVRSSWRSAKSGFRRSSYVFGPIAVLLAIPCLAVTFFAGGSGRGWAVPAFLLPACAVCGVAIVVAGLIGAIFGLIRGLFGRAPPKSANQSHTAAAAPSIRDSRAGEIKPRVIDRGSPKQGRSPLRRRAVAVAAMVPPAFALAYLAGLYAGDTVDRELASATAVAAGDDPHWRLHDLFTHRAPVSDAENSAPVVMKAAALLPEYMPDGETRTIPAMKTIHGFLTEITENVCLHDALAVALRFELEQCNEAVLVARTLAGYDRGRYDLELGPTVIDTLLPGLLKVREMARLLIADSAIRAHDKDPDGALDSCRAVLGASRSVGDEPFLMSQLVRIAEGIEAAKAVRRVLAQGEPSDRALARVQELLLDEMGQPLVLYALRGERAAYVEIVRRIGAGEVTIDELSKDSSKFDPHRPRDAVTPWAKLWFDYQRAVMLEWMNDAVNIETQPSADRSSLWEKWQTRFRVKQNSMEFWIKLLPLKVFPAVRSVAVAHSHLRADLGTTAILLAAERHRRKAGKWPESVAAIDKRILANPPADPFSGEPFRMEHRDGQLVVYSVGANRKDEHGEHDKKQGVPDDFAARAWDLPLRRQASDFDKQQPPESPSPP